MNEEHFWNLLAKKLSGEASAEEKAELENLLKAHPDFSFPAQQLTDLWFLNKTSPTPQTETAFQKHWLELQGSESDTTPIEASTKPRRIFWWPVTLLVVFIAIGSWFLRNKSSNEGPKPLSQKAEVSTRKGARTKLLLPDSSEVWLNAGSKLTYEPGFGINNRNTTLVGEAFFDVRKSSLPFVIHATGVRIKVLGTAFNVKSYPNEKTTETSLIRGRVEVTLDKRPDEPIFLKPNEKLIVSTAAADGRKQNQSPQPIVILKSLTHINDSLVAETLWVENKLVFADETFDEVARKMERWYNVNIDIKDSTLAQLRVGGGPFETETIGQALSALQIAFDFKFSIRKNYITITP